MCILLKLDYAKFGVSNLFFSKVIEEKHLGGWLDPLEQEGLKTDSGLVQKARLVARGFEESEDDVRKEPSTCSKDYLRIIMAIIAQKKWSLNTIDITTAFLQ